MNIFGGIVDCVIIANGILAACKEITVNIPIVVRLEGTIIKQWMGWGGGVGGVRVMCGYYM